MFRDKLTEKEIRIYKVMHFFGITITTGMVLWFDVFKLSEMSMSLLLIFMIPMLIAFAFGYAVVWDVRIIPGLNRSEDDKS